MRTIVTAGLALLALPGTASAASIHNYTVRDAGPEIVHQLTVCVNGEPGYETFVRERTHVETEDGRDRQTYTSSGWYSNGCNRVSLVYRDRLRYEGWYYGRARIVFAATGEVRYTRWRRFWSS